MHLNQTLRGRLGSVLVSKWLKMECSSIGLGFHLITNDEWMTVGANAAAQTSNWSGGAVGSGKLYRGHSDNSPASTCAASTDDTLFFVETDCTAKAAGGGEDDETTQKRIHNLSNGSIVWDLAGNVYNWVNYFNDTDKPAAGGSFTEYNTSPTTSTMPLSDLVPTNAVKSFWVGHLETPLKQSVTLFQVVTVPAAAGYEAEGFQEQPTAAFFMGSLTILPLIQVALILVSDASQVFPELLKVRVDN